MEFEEANQLLDRITAFLASCGGAYANGVTRQSQEDILHSLATGLFSMKEDRGEIVYFASFCKVSEDSLPDVRNRRIPADRLNGSIVYVTECGNKGGRRGMAEMIQGIRQKCGYTRGATWHRPVKQDKFYAYPRQRGEV